MDLFRFDFGYAWPWTWGHAIAAVLFTLLAVGLRAAGRPRTSLLFGALAVWGIAGAWIVNVAFGFSTPLPLPTQAFLSSGAGKVIDLGAGSGRATVMVLQTRPRATVTAVDIFSQNYGIDGNTPDRLRANVAAAGAADRLEVRTADIRQLPFEPATFDGAISSAVIDHLSRDGVTQSLAEVKRVLKPGGDFLLVVINPDGWIRVAFPMLAEHGYFGQQPRPVFWQEQLTRAGFDMVETGRQPGVLYLLAKSRPAPTASR